MSEQINDYTQTEPMSLLTYLWNYNKGLPREAWVPQIKLYASWVTSQERCISVAPSTICKQITWSESILFLENGTGYLSSLGGP